MINRSLAALLLALLLALWLERGATVRAYQGSGVPDWEQKMSDKLDAISRQVYLNTGTFTQRIDYLDDRVTGLSTRLSNHESGQNSQPADIARLSSEVTILLSEMSAIFAGVVTIILGGLGLAWLYFKKATQLKVELERHRAVIADELKSHEATLSGKLNEIATQTNGMSEHLQRLAGEKGFAAGVESVRNEDRAPG